MVVYMICGGEAYGTAEAVPLSKTGIIPPKLCVTAVTFRVRGAV